MIENQECFAEIQYFVFKKSVVREVLNYSAVITSTFVR